jgi:hypothetical protein
MHHSGQLAEGNIMGWEKGRYYTRSRKVDGQVIREYVGGGEIGRLAAEFDAAKRHQKQLTEAIDSQLQQDLEDQDLSALDLYNEIEQIAQAVLLVAGCHNHRGQWRRKRACPE